ncbi:RDD family protein [Kitasatospora sp. NPDC085879]|uniref:RDD family protein n=1 Tax=Kitasatospora sp. NPDC085879 TaxID=3154769 RepID=UPI00341FF94F
MSYPPDPNNPYSQQPPAPGYGYPQQAPPPAPGYGYPQQAPPPAPGYGAPGGYGIPPQPGPYGNAAQVQQFYAGWGSRVAAYIIDYLIVGVPTGIFYGIGAAVGVSKMECTTDPTTYAYSCSGGGVSGVGMAIMGLGWLLGIAGFLFLIHREGTTGQTPGKKMVNIRVLREADGQPLGFGMAFVRKICHVLDGFCCVGYLWPLWDAKKQTFADKVMSSVVVKSQ